MNPIQRPPYRPVCDTPVDQPDDRRKGHISHDPFEHFCEECGAWGAFGFRIDSDPAHPGVWYCGQHRRIGQERLARVRRGG